MFSCKQSLLHNLIICIFFFLFHFISLVLNVNLMTVYYSIYAIAEYKRIISYRLKQQRIQRDRTPEKKTTNENRNEDKNTTESHMSNT